MQRVVYLRHGFFFLRHCHLRSDPVCLVDVHQVRSALLAEVEETRKSWETERSRLQQELQEQRGAKRSAEEALAVAHQACQSRVAELRSAHHQHQEELSRTKRDCEREIRRLVGLMSIRGLHLAGLRLAFRIFRLFCLLWPQCWQKKNPVSPTKRYLFVCPDGRDQTEGQSG